MAVTNGAGGRFSLLRQASRVARFAATVGIVAARLPAPIAGQELQSRVAAQNLPAQLTDSAFWRLVTTTPSRAAIFAPTTSSRTRRRYQWVIPELLRTTKPGGVYLGVGPDQNFTYIVALQAEDRVHLRHPSAEHADAPDVQGADRAVDRSRRFPVAAVLAPAAAAARHDVDARGDLRRVSRLVPPDSARVPAEHRVDPRPADRRSTASSCRTTTSATIAYVYDAFVSAGPDITYNFEPAGDGFGRGRMPSYAELQIETDSVGVHRSYMANEANFRALKEIEANNLIVPLVGDFAGPTAIRAVGTYLKEHNATVTAFYLSNVEQYLFQQGDDWRQFFDNVGDAAARLDEHVHPIGVQRHGLLSRCAAVRRLHARAADARVDARPGHGVQSGQADDIQRRDRNVALSGWAGHSEFDWRVGYGFALEVGN